MSIENRDLKPGTKLTARYKGHEHAADVVQTEEGIRYRLADGNEYKSPSAAGSAVMGGTACNGWRFWTVAGEEKAAEPKQPKNPALDQSPVRRARARAKRNGLIERLEDQAGASPGMVRFFCSACMEAFEAPEGIEPLGCPNGHNPEAAAN